MPIDRSYFETLKGRRKQSRAHTRHQALGAELGEMLGDARHTALYIKLALQFDEERLRSLAKSVAEKTNIKNKGAYFMRLLMGDRKSK